MLSDLRVQTDSRENKGWGEKEMEGRQRREGERERWKVDREGKRRGRDGGQIEKGRGEGEMEGRQGMEGERERWKVDREGKE